MDDISDFWTWFRSPALPARLSRTHILAAGESAGGYLAIQSALLFNPAAGIRAVAATYPAQYPDVAAYNRRHAGVAADSEDDRVVDAYLAAVGRGEKAVRVATPWGMDGEAEGLIRAMGPTGRHREMMGADGRLTLGGGLGAARGRGGEGAAVWIAQGREDDLVSLVLSCSAGSGGCLANILGARSSRRGRMRWWKGSGRRCQRCRSNILWRGADMCLICLSVSTSRGSRRDWTLCGGTGSGMVKTQCSCPPIHGSSFAASSPESEAPCEVFDGSQNP